MTTDLEDRLRRDLTAFAERVRPQDIRGPQVAGQLRVARSGGRRRARRWLAPAGAAVAVAAVALGATYFAGSHSTTTTSPTAPVTAPHPGLPRFYVVLVQNPSGAKDATTAEVHNSVTGTTLTKVRLPTLYGHDGSSTGPGISAAADDRTYLITETNGSARFYLLRVAADGRSATVAKLPISWPRTLSPDFTAALSPDGTRLAIDVQACGGRSCHYSGVRVITLATGAMRMWTTQADGAPFQLSWAGNSRLAFEWQSGAKTPPSAQRTGYRLLTVTGRGADLLSGPYIATPPATSTGSMPAALVTADGSQVITTMTTAHRDGPRTDTVVAKVVELNAQTGKLLRVLVTTTVTRVPTDEDNPNSVGSLEQGCNVISLAPRGLNALVSCTSFGRIGSSGFTPLPGSPAAWDGSAFAW